MPGDERARRDLGLEAPNSTTTGMRRRRTAALPTSIAPAPSQYCSRKHESVSMQRPPLRRLLLRVSFGIMKLPVSRRTCRRLVAVLLCSLPFSSIPAAAEPLAKPWLDRSLSAEARAQALVAA